ncbi:MAG: GNAT family N-acetyltransferase [Dehalococcoidia bacterium]|nr:GNAT family N-acetyltransferase [Dehalococcoidia bacterium]
MRYELRPATADDFHFIYQVKAATLKEYVTQIWGWDEADQRARFGASFDAAQWQVVQLDGRDIGVLCLERAKGGLFLANIEILPPYQDRGIGTRIIEGILASARRDRLPVRLQVLKVNPARRLYERLGFGDTGATDTHYLMEWVPKP